VSAWASNEVVQLLTLAVVLSVDGVSRRSPPDYYSIIEIMKRNTDHLAD